MITKTLTKIVGLKEEEFDSFVETGEITLQEARLIPTLKTGDEGALTSIFLSTLKLVKEYRYDLFKDIGLSRKGKAYYYTEVCFDKESKYRIDGLIIVVVKGVIADAVLFEMKNKSNSLDKEQMEKYINVAKMFRIGKFVTISNEFVSEPHHSPIKDIRVSKSFSLLHFSWTYLITKGQLLLFDNDTNIADEDQVNIMRETLHYLDSPISGTCGYTKMKNGWKVLCENIHSRISLKASDEYLKEAILSWYEEEKDMALKMSRRLGIMVKLPSKGKDSIKVDIQRVMKNKYLRGSLIIKSAVSDIKVKADFGSRVVSMSVKVSPPTDRGSRAKVTWLSGQLEYCKKRGDESFEKLEKQIWVEADIKYAKENIKVKLAELSSLRESVKDKDVQSFSIIYNVSMGVNFASTKKFIVLTEGMALSYYYNIVQHLWNWTKPAPKLEKAEIVATTPLPPPSTSGWPAPSN